MTLPSSKWLVWMSSSIRIHNVSCHFTGDANCGTVNRNNVDANFIHDFLRLLQSNLLPHSISAPICSLGKIDQIYSISDESHFTGFECIMSFAHTSYTHPHPAVALHY